MWTTKCPEDGYFLKTKNTTIPCNLISWGNICRHLKFRDEDRFSCKGNCGNIKALFDCVSNDQRKSVHMQTSTSESKRR